LRILVYTHEFPPFRGGAGVYSFDLAVGLAALGQEVHVATPVTPSVGNAAEQSGIDALHMHYITAAHAHPADVRRFLAHLEWRYRFDFILVTERRAQEIFATMTPGPAPYAAAIHGTEVLDYFGGRQAFLALMPDQMLRFYEGAAICIAVSNTTRGLAKTLLPGGAVNLVAVQNGINLARLAPPDRDKVQALRRRFGDDADLVFCLGRLALDKGQDTLMRAFREVRQSHPRALLLVGGEGPARASLETLRTELELETCVEFVGAIPAGELPAYFDACSVFALTSRSENRWEGFGLVYLEAGYYGKAVIGGNEGGVPEAIADRSSGLLVPPRNEYAIASAISALLSDREASRQMGENGRRRVLEFFNSKRMAEETLQHIERALQRKKRPRWRASALSAWQVIREDRRAAVDYFLSAVRFVAVAVQATASRHWRR
jgi:phosphatidyl-myo-inositol dimannoside synthase